MENFYTIKQLSFILKVHQLTIRRYIREKKLTAIKVGGAVRVTEEALQKFQKSYSADTKRQTRLTDTPVKKIFTSADPLWRLEGYGTSISLPELTYD